MNSSGRPLLAITANESPTSSTDHGGGMRRLVIVASCAARSQRSRCRAVAARIGGGFSSGGGSLTGGVGGSSGYGGFGGSSMGGGGSFIGDGPLDALLFFETTNKVSPFTTGLFWPCSKRNSRSRCMFLTAASWRAASCCSASVIVASSRCWRSDRSESRMTTIWGCNACIAAPMAPAILGLGGLRKDGPGPGAAICGAPVWKTK